MALRLFDCLVFVIVVRCLKNTKPNPFSNTISNILGTFLGANPNTNPNIGKKKST